MCTQVLHLVMVSELREFKEETKVNQLFSVAIQAAAYQFCTSRWRQSHANDFRVVSDNSLFIFFHSVI